jgi:hypothetical protein
MDILCELKLSIWNNFLLYLYPHAGFDQILATASKHNVKAQFLCALLPSSEFFRHFLLIASLFINIDVEAVSSKKSDYPINPTAMRSASKIKHQK